MSSNQLGNVPARKSFAQVAAAANIPVKHKEINTNSTKTSPPDHKPSPGPVHNVVPSTPKILERPAEVIAPSLIPHVPEADVKDNVEQLSRLVETTSFGSNQPQPLPDGIPRKLSSDTKSATSRTTLTLDEKDSLRPDDSASMQAAIEDDGFSPGGSAVADSKQSSDPETRAFRDQLNEIDRTGSRHLAAQRGKPPEKAIAGDAPNGAILYPSNAVPESFPPSQQPVALDGPRPPNTTWNIPPDEKLIEALNSPKDRLFVLKIEQDMIDFVKDSKEEFLQLPQTNSFYRMLSHKLADYYLLGHLIDDSMTSVRIFRTPTCRLPPPLIGPNPAVDGSTPPPNAPTRKIMRRHREESKALEHISGSDKNFDSLTSSKAPSDIGTSSAQDEGKEAVNGSGEKSALTREERENRYNEARARIFKDFDETLDNNEASNAPADKEISRTSSASGTKKNKKTRKPKDDGFEARSAFDQYGQRIVATEYPQPPHANHAYGLYSSGGMQGQFPGGFPTFHPTQSGPVPNYHVHEGYGQPPFGHWPVQPPHIGYAHNAQNHGMQEHFNAQHYPSMNGYDGSQYSPGNMASQATPKGNALSLANYHQGFIPPNDSVGWAQGNYMNQYNASNYGYGELHGPNMGYYGSPGVQPATPASSGHFGSFPGQNAQFYGQSPPYNSFTNAHFNPQSQNFVPATRGGPMASFSPEPGMAYPNNHPGFSGPSPMQRQPSNNSRGSNFSPVQHLQQQQHPMLAARVNNNGQGQFRNQPSMMNRGSAHPQSSISKWSTPANLPAKPPPPAVMSPYVDVPRDPDNQRPLPPKPFSGVDSSSSNVKNVPNR